MSEKKVPKWATKHFRSFLEYQKELGQILDLSIRGISMIRGVPSIFKAISKAEPEDEKYSSIDAIEQAKELAEMAQREVDKEFPLLHSQALVTLWGSLESLIEMFLADWIVHKTGAMQAESVQKLRVRLGEYELLSHDERGYYIVNLLKQELGSPLKQGSNRFESLLKLVGLSGRIEDDVQKTLFEMNHLRNVFVHRRGIADKRLIEACPWLGYEVGDHVFLKHEDFLRYMEISAKYILELICRVSEHFGLDREYLDAN